MKDILDEESRKALINYRIQRAYETMKEAKLMIRETFYNAAVNRMYLKGIHVVLSMKKWRINVNEGVRKGYPHLYIIVNFWHYKIFCVNGNTGFKFESRIFYFIHLQNEEDYERKESSSA